MMGQDAPYAATYRPIPYLLKPSSGLGRASAHELLSSVEGEEHCCFLVPQAIVQEIDDSLNW
jgi:hypothetical protein